MNIGDIIQLLLILLTFLAIAGIIYSAIMLPWWSTIIIIGATAILAFLINKRIKL